MITAVHYRPRILGRLAHAQAIETRLSFPPPQLIESLGTRLVLYVHSVQVLIKAYSISPYMY